MKLSKYAKQIGVTYKTAWRLYHDGGIPNAYQLQSGTIVVPDEIKTNPLDEKDRVVVYARVSSSENKTNLDTQCDRLLQYCAARGYKVVRVIKEIGSGVDDSRPKFMSLLEDNDVRVIVIEHRDRATRFGFNYIKSLLSVAGRRIEVINAAEDGKDELMQDIITIITSFTARYYGRRRSQRKTERIIEELKRDD